MAGETPAGRLVTFRKAGRTKRIGMSMATRGILAFVVTISAALSTNVTAQSNHPVPVSPQPASASSTPSVPPASSQAIAAAYLRQKTLVTQRAAGVRPAGYKGGFVLPSAFRPLGLPRPAIGVLFAQGAVPASSSITVNPATTLIVEAEYGFTIARRITRPIRNLASLKAAVSHVQPVIELPEQDPTAGPRTGINLIAGNIGSVRFITGAPVRKTIRLGTSAAPRLYFNGKLAAEPIPDMVTMDHWETLRFLVNKALDIYGPIEPGQLFITGSIIQFPHRQPGQYLIDYGPLGTIRFDAK
jgi:2-keto-4-pentenoate hydratase